MSINYIIQLNSFANFFIFLKLKIKFYIKKLNYQTKMKIKIKNLLNVIEKRIYYYKKKKTNVLD